MTYTVLGKLKANPEITEPIRENIAELKEAEMEVSFQQVMSDKYSEVTIKEN